MKALATQSVPQSQAPKKQPAAGYTQPGASQLNSIFQFPIQRKASCACGGGCPRCGDDELGIQTKLTVGEPGDSYEQEADRVADLVMRMPDSRALHHDITSAPADDSITVSAFQFPVSRIQRQTIFVQRQADDESKEEPDLEESPLQLSPVAAGGMAEPPDDEDNSHGPGSHSGINGGQIIEEGLQRSRGAGSALPVETREFMEERFGMDLTNVRVHTNSDSNQLNQHLRAHAFTTGHDIYFAEGMYRPGTPGGDRLLAHELTHVVQQTGGMLLRSARQRSETLIQRASDDEVKSYTLPGNVVHRALEDELEKTHGTLMTEVPIPGGQESDRALNIRGFADLYESENNIVTGIRGKYPGSDPTNPLYYENINSLGRLSPRGRQKQGPRILTRDRKKKVTSWDTNPDFPSWFKVADIKPLSIFKIEGGRFQLENYTRGFEQFVAKVNTDSGGTTRATTSGDALQIKLPDAMDYKQFDTQHPTLGPHAVVLPRTATPKTNQKRIWVYELPNPKGIYVYFQLPHPFTNPRYLVELEDTLKKLDPLLVELREKHPKFPGQIATKRRPDAATTPAPAKESRRATPRRQKERIIQLQPATDWRKRRVDWENKRQAWESGDQGAKAFLKTAKGPLEKQEVDDALNITLTGAPLQQSKNLKKIELWSGTSGKLIGALRFRFGELFDKLGEFFKKVKIKFEQWFKGSDNLKPKGKLIEGWVYTATKVILKFAAEIMKSVLRLGYETFAACINGMIEKILDGFKGEIEEKVLAELEPVSTKVSDLHQKLTKEFAEYEEPINKFLDNVDEFKQWMSILSDIETAVRVGVQLVSCLSPPGLGCLWGLAAQFAISEGIELLTETDYFNDRIAKPTADKIMKQFIGNPFQNLVASSVDRLGLTAYAVGVAECSEVVDSPGGGGRGFFGTPAKPFELSPNAMKARDAWEARNKDKMTHQLMNIFVKVAEPGKPAEPITQEDINKLVEAIKKSKLDAAALRALIQGAKKDGTNLVKISEVLEELAKIPGQEVRPAAPDVPGEPPPSPTPDQPPPPPPPPPPVQKPKPGDGGSGEEEGPQAPQPVEVYKPPVYDGDRLDKPEEVSDQTVPNTIVHIAPNKAHQVGKVYDVTVDVYEMMHGYEQTINIKTGESSIKETTTPVRLYSVNKIKVLVLSIEPNIVAKKQQGMRYVYRILENVSVADFNQVIPAKDISSVLN